MAKIEIPIKDKKMVSLDEAAALMNVSRNTMKKFIRMKIVIPAWSGRNILIYSKDLEEASLELKKQGKIPLNGVTRRVLIPRDLFFEVYGI